MQQAYAHEIGEALTETQALPPTPTDAAMHFMSGVSIVLAVFFIVGWFKREWSIGWKVTLYVLICTVVIFTTIGLLGTTIELNVISPTHGPIHWHADYAINICGTDQEIIHSRGLANKTGTPLMHTHNDNRIHIEGTPRSLEELNLGHYFDAVGGSLSDTSISFPTDNGMVTKANGDLCDNGAAGTLRVFLEKQDSSGRHWAPLESPAAYVMSPFTTIPPGDRLYFSFDSADAQTVLEHINQLTHDE